jgi:hypothetical protein
MKQRRSIFRLTLPPWYGLNDPLISHEIQPSLRIGHDRSTVFFRFLALFGILAYIVYVVNALGRASDNAGQPTELLDTIPILLFGALLLLYLAVRYRLLFEVVQRATGMIAATPLPSSWELNAVTPIDKARWYRAHLTALSWQVWPITRQLVIVAGLATLLFFFISVNNVTEYQSLNPWNTEYCLEFGLDGDCSEYLYLGVLPPLVYAAAFIPFGLLITLFPLMESALYSSASLFASIRTQKPDRVVGHSLLAIYLVRAAMMFVFVYGGLLLFILLTDSIGSPNERLDRAQVIETVFLAGLVLSLFFAIGIEWLLFLPPLLLASQNTEIGYLMLFTWLLINFGLAYIGSSFLLLRWLAARTIGHLEQLEE